MKAEELKAKYMDSKMVSYFEIINAILMGDFIDLGRFFLRSQKPETEFTKQGYLFLMEKSKLSKFTRIEIDGTFPKMTSFDLIRLAFVYFLMVLMMKENQNILIFR